MADNTADFLTTAVKRGVSNAISSTVKTTITNQTKKLTGGNSTRSTSSRSKKNYEEEEEEQPVRRSSSRRKSSAKTWQCPLCMNNCDDSAAFCPSCGASRAAIQEAARQSIQQNQAAYQPQIAYQQPVPQQAPVQQPVYQQVVQPDGTIAYQQVQAQQPVYQQVIQADGSIAYQQINPAQIIQPAQQAPQAGGFQQAPAGAGQVGVNQSGEPVYTYQQ